MTENRDSDNVFAERRMAALRARKPLEYFEYCVASAVDHRENPYLYSEGSALFNIKRGDYSEVSALPVSARYALLTKKAERLSLRLDEDSRSKKKWLETLFPGQFGSKARQDLFRHTPTEIGVVFSKCLREAKKHSYDLN